MIVSVELLRKGAISVRTLLMWGVIAIARCCTAADLSGEWIAEINSKMADPQYARVELTLQGEEIIGVWDQMRVEGTLSGDRLHLALLRDGSPARHSQRYPGRRGLFRRRPDKYGRWKRKCRNRERHMAFDASGAAASNPAEHHRFRT
jgi:hypothetical protein